jgi:hypothetical protein
MGKDELNGLVSGDFPPLPGRLVGQQLVDILDAHGAQLAPRNAVASGGGDICVLYCAGLRLDKEHDRLATVEHAAEAFLAFTKQGFGFLSWRDVAEKDGHVVLTRIGMHRRVSGEEPCLFQQ